MQNYKPWEPCDGTAGPPGDRKTDGARDFNHDNDDDGPIGESDGPQKRDVGSRLST